MRIGDPWRPLCSTFSQASFKYPFLSARITAVVRRSEQVVLGQVEYGTYLSFVEKFLRLNSSFVVLLYS
jgi:hypothetical protein